MIHELNGWWYYANEREFVRYFDRLRDTGKTFDEVEAVLPDLETYYFEMVTQKGCSVEETTLENLFKKWKKSIEHPF